MLILQFKKISLKCHICTLIRDVIGLTFNAQSEKPCLTLELLIYRYKTKLSLLEKHYFYKKKLYKQICPNFIEVLNN